MSWEPQHNAEYSRLAAEMAEDARWQLQLFTFGVTASPIILTALKLWFDVGYTRSELPVPGGLFFLAPILILVPTSLIILNRARTRNRKAAFVVAFLDPVRLRATSATAHKSLSETLQESAVPWETALLVVERALPVEEKEPKDKIGGILKRNSTIGRILLRLPGFRGAVHLPPAVLAMIGSYFAIEAVCWFLAYRTLTALPGSTWMERVAMIVIAGLLFCLRLFFLLRLGTRDSIQEYVIRWVTRANGLGWTTPQYLAGWVSYYRQAR